MAKQPKGSGNESKWLLELLNKIQASKKGGGNPLNSKDIAPSPNDDDDDNPENYKIEAGDCFFHRESRKLYQVTGIENGLLQSGETVPIIVYVGIDQKIRKQNVYLFVKNFQKTFTPKLDKDTLKKKQNALHKKLGEMNGLDPENPVPISESDTSADGESVPLGSLYIPTDRHVLEKMILWPDAIETINIGLECIAKRKEIQEIWKLGEISDNANQNILNFYGPSGTGKTMSAKCIARKVNKKLFQVDYSQIVDKYVGETSKHISQAFATATEKEAILFFDEADGLLSKRVDMTVNSDYANSVNQNRNVLMQELDKFDDIVIMSTNFFCNYDEAMLRRINKHVEFKLPNKDMRLALYKLHIPNLELAKEVNFEALAEESRGLSGGDIKNVCINSMEAASMEADITKWKLTQEIMNKQMLKVLDSKESHKNGGFNKKSRVMGFHAPAVMEVD